MDFEHEAFRRFLLTLLHDPDTLFDKHIRDIVETVIIDGYKALSPEEEILFHKEILTPYTITACKGCKSPITWEDMYHVTTAQHGKCHTCHTAVKNTSRILF